MLIIMAALAAGAVGSASASASASVLILDPGSVGQAERLSVIAERSPAGAAGSRRIVAGRFYVTGLAGTAYSISQTLTFAHTDVAHPDAERVKTAAPAFIPASGRANLAVSAGFNVPRTLPAGTYGGVLQVVTNYN